MKTLDILKLLKLPLPKEKANSVRDVDYNTLISKGYDTFLFDYDNTLAVWRSDFDEKNKIVIEQLLKKKKKVAVVTNAPKERIDNLSELFGDKIKLYHSMKKPSTKEMQRVLKELKSQPEKTVIVGDLFLTDTIAGNRMGFYTVLVKPPIHEKMPFYKKTMAFLTVSSYMVFFYLIGWFFRILELGTPHIFLSDVGKVDYENLIESGYKMIIFDFDNTLEPWNSEKISDEKILLINRIKKIGMKIVIISNGKKKRIDRIKEIVPDIEVISKARKPVPAKTRKMLKNHDVPPHRAVIIGDQLFTDILLGNLLGTFTIKVNPLSNKDFFTTKILRKFERFALKFIKQRLKEVKKS
ncbi:MAG: YqeG family HAD IIIA-type phosphatase [Elusimicrobiota bacterium]